MKAVATFLLIGAFCALQPFTANARLIEIITIDGPQDPLFREGFVHELGWGAAVGGPFPPPQEIASANLGPTDQTSCFDGNDNPGLLNYLVDIVNLTGQDWTEVYYVADPETSISNFDGWMDEGLGPEEAFRIDSVGINMPLVFESIAMNGIFEIGETWTFILQDYSNAFGGTPEIFDSPGIAGASTGFPPSTGSIVAVPEPSTVALLAIASFVIGGVRRFTYRRMYR